MSWRGQFWPSKLLLNTITGHRAFAPLPQLSQLLGRESGEEDSLLTLASLERGPLHASPTITLSCPFTFFVAFISMLASFLGIAPFWSFWCIFKAPLCQLQTGTCHGHLPLQGLITRCCSCCQPLKGAQGREQKGGTLCWELGIFRSRFQEPNSCISHI